MLEAVPVKVTEVKQHHVVVYKEKVYSASSKVDPTDVPYPSQATGMR